VPEPGEAVEATLWGVVGRLRARGWPISLWEIQRAQDVIAYLFATLGRAPTGDELRRHLQPIFCARDRELATFAEVFHDSVPAAESAASDRTPKAAAVWRRRFPLLLIAGAVVVALGIALRSASNPPDPGPGPTTTHADPRWTLPLWFGVTLLVVAIVVLGWLAFRKRLRRRPASATTGPDLDLGWEATHPLDPEDGARVARVLRARTREPGRGMLDVPRTVDATIRAGICLTPHFREFKRAPEYLAVIEQRSAGDVLAGHYARVVDQLSAQGVAMRRTCLQPRSQLIIDPSRGPQHVSTLQPASERERLLLFAPDWPLRDPITGAERPWLARFDRWAETIRIDPDVHRARPLQVVDRVLDDVRALDPIWARDRVSPTGFVPTAFETGDQVWIEAVPPPRDELVRVMELLVTSLGPAGWLWLSACAIYPEISYELTVALGQLLKADDGRPVAEHLPLEDLARLPWFRHAYMPDWLRASLIGTLSREQLVQARGALDRILSSGLSGAADGLSIMESSPSDSPLPGTTDQVYLEGTALRRRRLAAAAPKPLVAAIRRQRNRLAMDDLGASRVRRALVTLNGLLVVSNLVFTVLAAIGIWMIFTDPDAWRQWNNSTGNWVSSVILADLVTLSTAIMTGVISAVAGRRRGAVLGIGLSILLLIATPIMFAEEASRSMVLVAFVAESTLAWIWTIGALRRRFESTVVPWPRFHRRNLIVFAAGVSFFIVALLILVFVDSDLPSWLVIAEACLLLNTLALVLAAAYVGGVRIVPVAVAAVLIFSTTLFNGRHGLDLDSLLVDAAALGVVIGFVFQLRRFRDRPAPEFWETRWYDWRRPLLAGVPGVAGVIAWILSNGNIAVTAWFFGIPAVFALLNAAAGRFSAFVARHRLDVRSPFHLD
jgi:hypothetical protein